MNWTAERVRALRRALRLTQEEFAERLQAAPKTVRNWELGRHPPGLTLQRALDQALQSASEDQLRRFQALQSSGKEEDTDRRQALRTLGGLTGAMLTSSYLESVELARQAEASDLGPTTLEQLDRVVEQLGLDYLHVPLPDLFAEALRCRQYVVGLLQGRHTLAQRRHLYAVAGRLSALLGHLSLNLGQDEAAHTHCLTALSLAREAGHERLAAMALGTRALVAIYAGKPREALSFAREGLAVAPAGSVGVFRLHAQEARALARMGDGPGVDDALAATESALDGLDEPVTTSILSFAGPNLPFYAGTCHLWLDRPRRAQECTRQAIALCDEAPDEWPSARLLARIDLAVSLVHLSQPEQASHLGAEALGLCRSGSLVASVRKRVVELRDELLPYRALPAVREFEERLQAVA